MKAKLVRETLYEAFEERNKDVARKELLFPGLSEIKDMYSYLDYVKKYSDIPVEAIPDEIKEKIYDSIIEGYDKYIDVSNWGGDISEWEAMKKLFSKEQIYEILDNSSNSFGVGIFDKDENIIIHILKKQNMKITREQIENAINGLGWKDFSKMIDKYNIKLTANNLIAIGIKISSKEYIDKGLAKGGKGRAKDMISIQEIIGKEEYDNRWMKKLTPEEIFTRGYNTSDSTLMIKAIKAGATNIHQQHQDAFNNGCIQGDLKLVDALMKAPRFNPVANAKDGAVNHRDEKHYGIRQAAKRGHLDIVKRLLKDPKVDPSYRKNFALKWALKGKHDKVVKLLLKDKRVKDKLYTLPKNLKFTIEN